jgi:hypothetical protein
MAAAGVRRVPQQRTALREFRLTYPVGQEAEVPHPMEATRRDVQQQTPQEFHSCKRQGAQAVATLIILVAEGHGQRQALEQKRTLSFRHWRYIDISASVALDPSW